MGSTALVPLLRRWSATLRGAFGVSPRPLGSRPLLAGARAGVRREHFSHSRGSHRRLVREAVRSSDIHESVGQSLRWKPCGVAVGWYACVLQGDLDFKGLLIIVAHFSKTNKKETRESLSLWRGCWDEVRSYLLATSCG